MSVESETESNEMYATTETKHLKAVQYDSSSTGASNNNGAMDSQDLGGFTTCLEGKTGAGGKKATGTAIPWLPPPPLLPSVVMSGR